MKYKKCDMIQKYDTTQKCNMSHFQKKEIRYKKRELIIKKPEEKYKNVYALKQEFEIWIKNMNYQLFLEHTHSKEYYIQKQYFLTNENKEKGFYEKIT